MNIDIEFEKIKNIILLTAKAKGLSKKHLDEYWSIDYKTDQNEEFGKIICNLNEEMKLLEQAINNDDMLTAVNAIVMIKL